MPQHTRPRKENGCIITSAFSVKTGIYEGDPVLVFADIVAVILRSPADCDQVIKAAVAAKLSMDPPDVPPADRCVCGHLATDHGPEEGHPCTMCDCTEYRWMPDEPVSLWHSLTGPAQADWTDGSLT